MSWEIVVGIIALVGFGISVVTPILKLNTNIIKLNDSIDHLKESITRIDDERKKEEEEIWDYVKEDNAKLKNHEVRITNIEHTMDLFEKQQPEFAQYRIK